MSEVALKLNTKSECDEIFNIVQDTKTLGKYRPIITQCNFVIYITFKYYLL
jgi:hypothetical protein